MGIFVKTVKWRVSLNSTGHGRRIQNNISTSWLQLTDLLKHLTVCTRDLSFLLPDANMYTFILRYCWNPCRTQCEYLVTFWPQIFIRQTEFGRWPACQPWVWFILHVATCRGVHTDSDFEWSASYIFIELAIWGDMNNSDHRQCNKMEFSCRAPSH